MPGVKGRSGGRNAKTVAQHTLTGTYRRDRHGDRRNPEPPAGAPDRPPDLQGAAAAEWDRVVADLVPSGSIATVDGAALRSYCELHATADRLQREVNGLPRLSHDDRETRRRCRKFSAR
jgi:phage terminase small subunit